MNSNGERTKPCLVACSVLKKEINQLMRQGDLDVDIVFVSKLFHIDYAVLEKNLRRTIEQTLPRVPGKVILVYGDLCLGPNNEMKSLAAEYGIVKIDALNCVDCLLGGHGKIEEADPNYEFMFMDPGMIEFFREAKEQMKKEGLPDDALKSMFGGIKGIVLLDTLGEAEKCKAELEELDTGLQIIEVKKVGVDNVKQVLHQAIQISCQQGYNETK